MNAASHLASRRELAGGEGEAKAAAAAKQERRGGAGEAAEGGGGRSGEIIRPSFGPYSLSCRRSRLASRCGRFR